MGTAVQYVHHRHGQGLGIDAADIVIKAVAGGLGRGLGAGQRSAQNSIGAQTGLVGGAVYLNEHFINRSLIQNIQAQHGLGDLTVDVFHGHLYALAVVAALVAVAKLAGLVHSGGRAGGHSGPADGPVIQRDLYLHGGVAPGVQDLSCHDVYDFKILFHR